MKVLKSGRIVALINQPFSPPFPSTPAFGFCVTGGSEDHFTEASPRIKLAQRRAKMRQREREREGCQNSMTSLILKALNF